MSAPPSSHSLSTPSENQAAARPHAPDLRTAQLLAWLTPYAKRYALDLSTCHAASSDAGARRYFRIHSNAPHTPSFIAVDAPPPEKNQAFAKIAMLFSQAGIQVPKVLEYDFEQGFMLLTDLGNTLYLTHLIALQNTATPIQTQAQTEARALYDAALNALILWQCATHPNILPEYDTALLRQELELFPTWYLERHLGLTLSPAQRSRLDTGFTLLIDTALSQPRVFVHRDYMPRNLMVYPNGPGVLDFQDAVLGPITYDAISLFRDAFISWDEAFERDCLQGYWQRAQNAGLPVPTDFPTFYRALEWMGLQRHLKVLGIFARLCYRDGKAHYLQDAPRFLKYIHKVTARYAELKDIAQLLQELSVLPTIN